MGGGAYVAYEEGTGSKEDPCIARVGCCSEQGALAARLTCNTHEAPGCIRRLPSSVIWGHLASMLGAYARQNGLQKRMPSPIHPARRPLEAGGEGERIRIDVGPPGKQQPRTYVFNKVRRGQIEPKQETEVSLSLCVLGWALARWASSSSARMRSTRCAGVQVQSGLEVKYPSTFVIEAARRRVACPVRCSSAVARPAN